MSPISISPRPPEGEHSIRSFRRTFAWTVGILLVLCGVFLALGYLQGPKLSSAQVDADAVVSSSDQTLRLFANQTLAAVDAGAVSVDPAVAATVSSDGDLISVQFAEALDYNTEYTVSVEGVVSPSGGSESTLTYSFTTAEPTLYYLDRGEPNDEIVETGMSSQERTVVYSGEGIEEFVPVGDVFAVSTAAADRTGALTLVNPDTGVTEQVLLPEVGEVADLDAARSSSLLGFTISSLDPGPIPTVSHTLYTLDVNRGRDVVAVTGLDGEPMRVVGWQFVPGTTTIVALTTESTLVRVDTTSGLVVPLGGYFEFDRVSADGSTVVVVDARGSASVALVDGEEVRLNPSPIDGEQPFLGQTDADAAGNLVAKMVLVSPDGGSFSSVLAYDDGELSRILYQTVDDKGAILDFHVSPNNQFVAVEVQPNVSNFDSDEYVMNPRPQSVTTYLVEIATGAVTRSVEGFGLVWR
ncbi:Ig-like domain-containing protein [Salinibacterium sp. SWN139]|uniref:Ig-like domain-containing protein n=1 Tax=Salinibacterium sp. SWN139 TaxID=2792055 RepID=UPI0027DA991A|nr:Ig-like domain-containing protein [Salinibacterium sp. SWN139]